MLVNATMNKLLVYLFFFNLLVFPTDAPILICQIQEQVRLGLQSARKQKGNRPLSYYVDKIVILEKGTEMAPRPRNKMSEPSGRRDRFPEREEQLFQRHKVRVKIPS